VYEEIVTRNHNQKMVTINPTLTIISCLKTPGLKGIVRFEYSVS